MTLLEQAHLNQLKAIVQYAALTLVQAAEFADGHGMPERAELLSRMGASLKPVYTDSTVNVATYVRFLQEWDATDNGHAAPDPDPAGPQLVVLADGDPPAHPEEPEPQKGETAVATEPGSVDEAATPDVRERWTRAVSKRGGRPAKRKRAPRNSHSGVVNPGSSTI